MSYDEIRALAGSIGVVTFFVFFIACFLWEIRPGAAARAREAARIPFKEE